MTFNKKIDRLESGTATPKSPNDETIWVDTNNNSIKRYNETNDSWVSVGGTGGAADTGDITFNGVQIIGDGTIELVPDSSLNSDQYLIIDPTAPNHVHIRAGGAIDASNADLIIGGEETNILVSDTGEYVDINTTSASGSYVYRFDSAGYLTGPAMGGLFVSGLLNGEGDLWLGSNYNVILSPGEGEAFIGDASIVDNQIATLGDITYRTTSVPVSSTGQLSDVAGLVADDASYHYYCTGSYDGDTHIWKRVAWDAGTWSPA